jgi:hypothetical protein
METAQRGLFLQIVLAACLAASAASAQDEPKRCRTDALEKWYCAIDPRGTAVADKLGRIVCAPGACAKSEEKEKEWMCSSVSGGNAVASPKGPVCDGECRAPETTACQKI